MKKLDLQGYRIMMVAMKKIWLMSGILFLVTSSHVMGENLTLEVPLSAYLKSHPDFLKNHIDTEYVALRCGGLYRVLYQRIEEAERDVKIRPLVQQYQHANRVYEIVGLVFSKSPNSSQTKFLQRYDETVSAYSSMVLRGWKKNNDLFQGVVGRDLDTCNAQLVYFEKLSKNFAKDLKR
jgi:hypothetical protein